MKKELTVYKNELNTISFRKFNAVEMNLFFSLCSKMRNKGITEIQYSFDDLKEISQYSSRDKNRFIKDLENIYRKMTQLSYRYEDKKRIDYFIIFSGFSIDKENGYIDISVNPKLAHILNKITNNFTKFELEEFTNLRSSYSKTVFRLLKQFRQTGFWTIQIDEFRDLLDVPKSYTTSDLNKRVFKLVLKELAPIFKKLKLTKIKAKKSNKTEYLEFSFTPQDDIKKDGTKIFKDNNDKYYENDIEHFTQEEINKSFPTI